MKLSAAFVTLILCATINAAAQSVSATKFDSYGRLDTDDEAAAVYRFAEALRRQPDVQGYLVGYNQASIARGVLLRRLHGDVRYLTEKCGVDRKRVVAIEGGYAEAFTIELWLVPRDAVQPMPSPTASIQINAGRYLFDEDCLQCEPAVNLDLDVVSDGLIFYAGALRENPNRQAVIVVRPAWHLTSRQALSAARQARWRLIRDYKIAAGRISINLAQRRKDNLSTAELWIVPKRAKTPRRTQYKSLDRSALNESMLWTV